MTPLEFQDAQFQLMYTNPKFAEALGMSIRSVEEMRAGRRPVTKRTAMQVKALLKEPTNEKR